MCAMPIGELSRRTDTPAATIRYYESLGLMPEPARGPGGQRRYGAGDVARLRFIRTRRDLGFSLADIRGLLALTGPATSPCAEAVPLAREQLARVRRQIAALAEIEATLVAQIAACGPDCGAGAAPDCLLVPPPARP